MGIDDGHQNDANDANPPADPQPPPPLHTGPRGRAAAVGGWLRRRSTHVLVVALVAAIVPVFLTRGLDWLTSDPPPKCPGPACDGKNADRYGCPADAQTVEAPPGEYDPV